MKTFWYTSAEEKTGGVFYTALKSVDRGKNQDVISTPNKAVLYYSIQDQGLRIRSSIPSKSLKSTSPSRSTSATSS